VKIERTQFAQLWVVLKHDYLIWNILIMVDDLNIRDSDWNLSYSFHSSYSDILVKIVDSFDLTLSLAIQQASTWYSNNENNSNPVINLLFLWSNFAELNNHEIHLEL